MEKEKLNSIVERIEGRSSFLKCWAKMEQKAKDLMMQEIQRDHQKLLFWESQASPEEKEELAAVRQRMEKQQQEFEQIDSIHYQKAVQNLKPRQTVIKNTIMAFLVGGLICSIGQVIINLFVSGGLPIKDAGAATAAVLVFGGALFTGLGIYDELGRVAGAGSIVPITGFANSVASSALEFKREGYIYGVGARLFTIAGPVIVYGTVVSTFIGLSYYFWG